MSESRDDDRRPPDRPPSHFPPGEVPRWVAWATLLIGLLIVGGWCCGWWLSLPYSLSTYTTPKGRAPASISDPLGAAAGGAAAWGR